MSNFNPFSNNPYSAFLRQQDEERRRREGRLLGTTQQPDDDWAGRPVVKGRWPGKYPTLVEELPDSIADLPNWNEDDFRQLSPKILDAIFGSHATQISLLPTLLQIEKAEAKKRQLQYPSVTKSTMPDELLFAVSGDIGSQPQAMPQDENSEGDTDLGTAPVPREKPEAPDELAEWANPTGGGVRTEDQLGNGAFGAGRSSNESTRTVHEGADYIADPGQAVGSAINGLISDIGYVYAGDFHYRIVDVEGAQGYEVRHFYVDPSVSVGQYVDAGEIIGYHQSLQEKYPGITEHVHVEVTKDGSLIDPESVIP